MRGITAVQLETLTDDSLPGMGPGRGDPKRPNFVLTEFQLTAAPLSDPNNGRPAHFVSARADYSQKGYDVAGAIDWVVKKGWAIGQEFHKRIPPSLSSISRSGGRRGSALTFTLQQSSGARRTIGRLRLSATTSLTEQVPDFAADGDLGRLQAEKTKSMAAKVIAASKTLVMKELPQPRVTHVLRCGNFLDPAEVVTPGTPAFLGKPVRRSANRLTGAMAREP